MLQRLIKTYGLLIKYHSVLVNNLAEIWLICTTLKNVCDFQKYFEIASYEKIFHYQVLMVMFEIGLSTKFTRLVLKLYADLFYDREVCAICVRLSITPKMKNPRDNIQ